MPGMKKKSFGKRNEAAKNDPAVQEKRKAALAKKEEETIKRNKKKEAKKQDAMTPKESFLLVWNIMVIMVVGFVDGIKWAWNSAMEYMNFAGKLGTILVDALGEGNSIQKDNNARVAGSALSYIIMLPLYILAGISGVFIYNIKNDKNERLFTKKNSSMRSALHHGSLIKYLLTSISPFVHMVRLIQYTDTSNYDYDTTIQKKLPTKVGDVLVKFPYIASFFIPILIFIVACPTLKPSLFSILLTTAVISFFVGDQIFQIWTGKSYYQEAEELASQRNALDEDSPDFMGVGLDGQINPFVEANIKKMGLGDVSDMSNMAPPKSNPVSTGSGPNSNQLQAAASMTVGGIALKLAHSLFHVILGLLSILPAAYGSAFYVWTVTLVSWVLQDVTLKRILSELNTNSDSFQSKTENKTIRTEIRGLVSVMNSFKCVITSIFCILISMSVLLQIHEDTPLFVILSAIVIVGGLILGGSADIVLAWMAAPGR